MLQCNLKYWREKRNLSQRKLEKVSGVSQTEISDIENFKKNPTIDTLAKLAEALNVCPKSLILCDIKDCLYSSIDVCNNCGIKNNNLK